MNELYPGSNGVFFFFLSVNIQSAFRTIVFRHFCFYNTDMSLQAPGVYEHFFSVLFVFTPTVWSVCVCVCFPTTWCQLHLFDFWSILIKQPLVFNIEFLIIHLQFLLLYTEKKNFIGTNLGILVLMADLASPGRCRACGSSSTDL